MNSNNFRSIWNRIKNFTATAAVSGQDKTRLLHYSGFMACAIPAMVVFGVISLIQANYVLSILILVSAITLIIGWVLLLRMQKKGQVIYRINTLFFFALVFYMVYMGGEEGSKSLWIFTSPLIVLFLLGLKEGIIWCSFVLVFLISIFALPPGLDQIYPYPLQFKLRFLIIYIMISFLTCWFEYFRSYYQKDLEIKNEALNEEQARLFKEIRERKRLEKDLKQIANTDPLTGVMNRRYFWKRANNEISRHQRFNHPMAILMLDIDHFKSANDTFGHPAGDKMLKSLTGLLKERLRKVDLIARIGGEEFAVLLVETPEAGAIKIANRILKLVKQEQVSHEDQTISVTVSIGVAPTLMTDKEETIETLISRADNALYDAKNSGRNTVRIMK